MVVANLVVAVVVVVVVVVVAVVVAVALIEWVIIYKMQKKNKREVAILAQ